MYETIDTFMLYWAAYLLDAETGMDWTNERLHAEPDQTWYHDRRDRLVQMARDQGLTPPCYVDRKPFLYGTEVLASTEVDDWDVYQQDGHAVCIVRLPRHGLCLIRPEAHYLTRGEFAHEADVVTMNDPHDPLVLTDEDRAALTWHAPPMMWRRP